MNKKINIEIERIKYGQERAYADSIYEYIITVDDNYQEEFIKK